MAEWKRKRVGWRAIVAPAALAVALAAAAGPVSIAAAKGGPGKGAAKQEQAPVLNVPGAPATSGVAGTAPDAPAASDTVEVIVRGRGFSGESAVDAAATEVAEAGGVTGDEVPLVGGVVAEMSLAEAQKLDAEPGVVVVPNETIAPTGLISGLLGGLLGGAKPSKPNKLAIQTSYPFTTDATGVWDLNQKTGTSTTVAVVDSGVADIPELSGRLTHVNVNPAYGSGDGLGHGTHVAATIAGRGAGDSFVGVAPGAKIIDVKVLDANGLGDLATVLNGLQWVSKNAAAYNIKVVNLSLGSSTPLKYTEHPLNAAVEALWRQGITVVVAAGNSGASTDAVSRPPGNDPFVITVGASDERGTRGILDDTTAGFSSRGVTLDGVAKPDVYAPGVSILAPTAPNSLYANLYPFAMSNGQLSMSGSSMATAVTSGVVALMLDRKPTLAPGQVKGYLLKTSKIVAGMRLPDAYDAANDVLPVTSTDQGLVPAPTLGTVWGSAEATASWAKASWARASWARGSVG